MKRESEPSSEICMLILVKSKHGGSSGMRSWNSCFLLFQGYLCVMEIKLISSSTLSPTIYLCQASLELFLWVNGGFCFIPRLISSSRSRSYGFCSILLLPHQIHSIHAYPSLFRLPPLNSTRNQADFLSLFEALVTCFQRGIYRAFFEPSLDYGIG